MSKSGRRVRIFSALEVANICGVVNQTAINWIRSGHLKAFTTPGGQYRIYAKDLAAFLDKRGMSASGEVLQVMRENANWNSFLIAADGSINDNLKAEIGNLLGDYNIIQAFDWFEIGRKLTEEKPGFILLDVELPGVDILKFTHTVKEDPSFGKPVIYLLVDEQRAEGISTIFTNQADLILTKPLDLGKLEAAIKSLERQLDAAVNA
ncbi:MAG: helix-turn-helix domain-containing protein [Treponema sp.]|jgi:excisionase family DNA binding protein|nr:helix-turn-helix domain-containing protein [Treponema sp.]